MTNQSYWDVTHANDDYLEETPDTNSQTGDADLHHDDPPQLDYPDNTVQPQKYSPDQTQVQPLDFERKKMDWKLEQKPKTIS